MVKLDDSSLQATFLTSWKEIAAYLGKGVRTVQRWELLHGLPVHHQSRAMVTASRAEISDWLTSQWTQRAHPDTYSIAIYPKHDPLLEYAEAARKAQATLGRIQTAHPSLPSE